MLLAACSGSGSSGGSPNPTGVLRFGYDFASQFTNLDPGHSTGDCDALVQSPIFDTLIHQDAGGNLLPGLASSWSIQGQTLTLHIRPGVKFSDGEVFDANAVKLGLEHLEKDTTYVDLATITSITVPDPMTVVVTLKGTPPIQVLYSLRGREGMIVAPNHIATATTDPVGAGPMEFKSYSPGASVIEQANPTYWQKGSLYKFGGINFTQVGVGPPSVTALKAGSVDMVSIQPDNYSSVKSAPGIGVAVANTTAYLQLQFRFTPPFDNLDVRKAAEDAINRAQVNQVVQSGLGEVANQTFFKSSPGYNPAVANLYPFNPTKAHQLLVQSGLPLPIKITLAIPGGNISSMEDQGAIIQQDLNAVGFSVTISRILGSQIATNYYINGQGNAFSAERPGEPYPPVQINDQWGKGQFVAIYSKGERPDISAIIQRALNAPSAAEGYALTRQAEAIVMQDALDLPIAFAPELEAYSTSTVGGAVKAQTGVCDAPDLSGVLVKKA
jgi:ABC-type transport system substrate-binding protein